MNMETFSVILEIIAFFLVTIDLYGEERLKTLHQKIRGVQGSLHAKLEGASSKSKAFIYLLENLKGYSVAILIVVTTAVGYYVFNYHKASVASWSPVVSWALLAFLLLLLWYEISMLLGSAFQLGCKLLLALVSLSQRLLSKTQFSGLLIIIGATIFVISKVILLLSIEAR